MSRADHSARGQSADASSAERVAHLAAERIDEIQTCIARRAEEVSVAEARGLIEAIRILQAIWYQVPPG